jgi:hypothetical protein
MRGFRAELVAGISAMHGQIHISNKSITRKRRGRAEIDGERKCRIMMISKFWQESGSWMMLGENTFRIITTSINGVTTAPYIDDYRIESLDDKEHRYLHLDTTTKFSAIRVDENFTFPRAIRAV